ncbi:MAG: hypothetical protein OXR68_01575 [Alphaproteobacteria bacterium]|nr:hypothetical protein [Alphaproteobacteria bacterium]
MTTASMVVCVEVSHAATTSGWQTTTILNKAGITKLPDIKMRDLANFGDCLDFKVKVKAGKCKKFFVPLPAVKLTIENREPTSIIEMSCLRGKTGFKSMQNVLSRGLSASLTQSKEQKCIEPIKSKWGDYHKYYMDVHVWGMSDISRFQTSGSANQVMQSLLCKTLVNLNTVVNIANFATNLKLEDWSNFSVSDITGIDITKGINDFAAGLEPGKILDSVGAELDNAWATATSLPATAGNMLTSFKGEITSVGAGISGVLNKISTLDPNSVVGEVEGLGKSFLSGSAFKEMASIGSSLGNFSNSMSAITNIPGVSLIPGVSSFQAISGQMGDISGYLGLAGAIDPNKEGFGMFDFQNLLSGTAGLEGVGEKMISTAQAMEPGLQALDDLLPQDIQVASLGGSEGMVGRRFSDIAKNLYEVGLQLKSLDYDKVRQMQRDLDEIIAKLGLEEGPKDIVKLARKNGRLAADGFIKNGGSELAVTQGDRTFDGIVDSVLAVGEKSLQMANSLGAREEGNVCYAVDAIDESFDRIKQFKEAVEKPDFELGMFPKATYLPQGHVQYVQDGLPSPSCPLTSAGYVADATLNGIKKNIHKCHKECVSSDEVEKCDWVPNKDYYLPKGSSCMENRMSTTKVDGLYPACNGIYPEVRQGYDGEKIATGRYLYKPEWDHRKKLERRRSEQLRHVVLNAYNNVNKSKKYIYNYKNKASIACDGLQQITPKKENSSIKNTGVIRLVDAQSMRPDHRQRALKSLGLEGRMQEVKQVQQALAQLEGFQTQVRTAAWQTTVKSAGSGGVSPLGASASPQLTLSSAYSKLQTALQMVNKGALRQYASAAAASRVPYGLWLGFASEATDWMKPRFNEQSLIMGAIHQVAINTPLYAVCSGGAFVNTLLPGELVNLRYLEKVFGCIGSWGMSNEHGFAYNKVKPIAGALIGARAYRVATKIGGIQDDISGKARQFNHEYPKLYGYTGDLTKVASKGGGKHKGSGCYGEGTTSSSWYTAGENGTALGLNILPSVVNIAKGNPNLQAEMDEGYYVQTRWKHTKCEVKFSITDILKFIDPTALALAITTGDIGPCAVEMKY